MELKITEQKENPLFKRKEIKGELKSNLPPKKGEVIEFIAKKVSSKPENIAIKKILGKFGSNSFKIIANIYHSEKDKTNFEPKQKKKGAKQ